VLENEQEVIVPLIRFSISSNGSSPDAEDGIQERIASA